ncbi:MAG: hypothetical protein RLZZ148_1469 [Cyanobacteriota bacterium]|jgi:hypothetical protein
MIDLVRPSIWRLLTRVGDRIADNKTSKTHKWQGLQPKVTFHENRLDKINIALTCQEWAIFGKQEFWIIVKEWRSLVSYRMPRLLRLTGIIGLELIGFGYYGESFLRSLYFGVIYRTFPKKICIWEYWNRRETDDPLPKDFACEVTIPIDADIKITFS